MIELPRWVHRAPYLFYGAAFITFFFMVWLSWTDVSAAYGYAETENAMARMVLLRAVCQALLESLYLAGTGVLSHILLAILSRLPRAANNPGADQ